MSLLRLTQGEEIERKEICPKFTHAEMGVEWDPNCLNSELFPWEIVCMHTCLCTCLGKGACIYAWPTLQCQTDKSKQFSRSQTLHIWNRIKVMLWIWVWHVIDNSISPTPKVLFSSFCKICLNYSQEHVYWKMSFLNNDSILNPRRNSSLHSSHTLTQDGGPLAYTGHWGSRN